ncbi:hypothetical protein [Shouchella miscanthi]|uniref:Uncharacterized protein n=1 Tax=Shouchella miscanthi TaxID=2598861 RepID=A0ABU6NNX7_9BACI|nr:hypothetical protein [Shouchella miscanthi]
MKSLAYYNGKYESILHSGCSEYNKSRQMAALMTDMEKQYKIPMLRNVEWEKDNRSTIALYRKISRSRSVDFE